MRYLVHPQPLSLLTIDGDGNLEAKGSPEPFARFMVQVFGSTKVDGGLSTARAVASIIGKLRTSKPGAVIELSDEEHTVAAAIANAAPVAPWLAWQVVPWLSAVVDAPNTDPRIVAT